MVWRGERTRPGAAQRDPDHPWDLVRIDHLPELLAWIMPGVNAVVAPFTRPDLLRNAPWRKYLPFFGVIWLLFSVTVYWFAGIDPIWEAISRTEEGLLSYLNTSGITFALFFFALGIVIYIIQRLRIAAAGVDTRLLYR